MIKITVRYHHHHPSELKQSAGVSSTQHRRISTSVDNQTLQGSDRNNSKMSLTSQTSNSSVVEIKYRQSVTDRNNSSNRHNHSSPASKPTESNLMHKFNVRMPTSRTQQQQPPPPPSGRRKVAPRPRGSLSSCSSSSPDLSGTEEYFGTYDERDEEEDDYNGSSSVFDDEPAPQTQLKPTTSNCDQEIKKTETLTGPTIATNNHKKTASSSSANSIRNIRAQNRNKLHARSISLIVNPNFGIESGETKVVAQQQQQQQEVDTSDDLDDDDQGDHEQTRAGQPNRGHFCPLTKRRNSLMGSRLQRPNLEKLRAGQRKLSVQESVCEEAPRAITQSSPGGGSGGSIEMAEKFKVEEDAAKQTDDGVRPTKSEDKSARLREIGFILRQISEEFERNRRLTV